MFQILAYIKFFFSATNKHGIHSPFVYNLVTNVFNDKKNYSFYETLNKHREKLYQNHQTIEVTDFGSGSRVFKNNSRKISAIAKNAGLTSKRAQLLSRLTKHFSPTRSLEIGTSLGLGTAAMHLGNPKGKITTLEGCPITSKIAQNLFFDFNFTNTHIVVGEFDKYLNDTRTSKKHDLIYFDGNHQKKATIKYFNKLVNFASNNTIYIFDDIHWSKEMEEAWELIKQHPKVSISIDTFFWGIIFFRNENKHQEHFKIRL